ncbi:AAA family ATPase [Haliscomenobacter sp.]|uniref:AAA family ATPase n=1 Tax=Haliscomenobacter sp. TaxID=2717303 RepID=UPI003BA92F07
MLITFRVANFLSFNAEEEFSMLAGKVRKPVRPAVTIGTGVDVLKMAVVYGANASGKSNLVRSIDFAKKVIVNGVKNVVSFEDHFRLEKGNYNQPTKFEFEFKLGDKCYAYGYVLQLNTKIIIEEWLYELKKTTQKPIFERTIDSSGISVFKSKPTLSGENETRFSIYTEDLQNHELLLSTLGNKQWPDKSYFLTFTSILKWFKQSLIVFYTDTKINPYAFIESTMPGLTGKEFMSEMLQQLGTGIDAIELIAEDAEQIINELPHDQRQRIIDRITKGENPYLVRGRKRYIFSKEPKKGEIIVSRVITKHGAKGGVSDEQFDYEDESDGTKRLFDFIPLLRVLTVPGNPVTVILDEIDRSLHPELLHKLIAYYLSFSKDSSSQLIVTTHESSLLDLSLLRRDEVWFVEKNKQGESHLYSLEEFQPRFDKEIRKAYLQGRYGAIPFISDVQQLNWETANAEG